MDAVGLSEMKAQGSTPPVEQPRAEHRECSAVEQAISSESPNHADRIKERNRIIRKLDKHLLPQIFVMYSFSVLDRSNLGNARIAGMEDEIDISGRRYDWLGTAFYIACESLPLSQERKTEEADIIFYRHSFSVAVHRLAGLPSTCMGCILRVCLGSRIDLAGSVYNVDWTHDLPSVLGYYGSLLSAWSYSLPLVFLYSREGRHTSRNLPLWLRRSQRLWRCFGLRNISSTRSYCSLADPFHRRRYTHLPASYCDLVLPPRWTRKRTIPLKS